MPVLFPFYCSASFLLPQPSPFSSPTTHRRTPNRKTFAPALHTIAQPRSSNLPRVFSFLLSSSNPSRVFSSSSSLQIQQNVLHRSKGHRRFPFLAKLKTSYNNNGSRVVFSNMESGFENSQFLFSAKLKFSYNNNGSCIVLYSLTWNLVLKIANSLFQQNRKSGFLVLLYFKIILLEFKEK